MNKDYDYESKGKLVLQLRSRDPPSTPALTQLPGPGYLVFLARSWEREDGYVWKAQTDHTEPES